MSVTEKRKLTHIEYVGEQVPVVSVKHTINTNNSVACLAKVSDGLVWMSWATDHVCELFIQLALTHALVSL